MALPRINPMEVVFSFDTTGSMSQVLDRVKIQVNDIIQRLQADIPGFKVGIIAHGDYCDAEHFYDIRRLDLSDNVADVVTFVNETDGTGGGDIPECYEMSLRQAKQMSWSDYSRKVLVVIGDAYPHEADYPLNIQNIDWRSELADLQAMNVRIYGVQVQNEENSTQFFQQLTSVTDGQHLQLADMGRICEVILGICYREQGPEMFKNYEDEVRHREAEKFGPDLECMFGTLRHEVSRTSDVTAILDNDDDSDDDFGDNDMLVDKNNNEHTDGNSEVDPKATLKRVWFDDSQDSAVSSSERRTSYIKHRQTKSQTIREARVEAKKQKRVAVKKFITKKERTKPFEKAKTSHRKPYREHISNKSFIFNSLPWSPWHLAVCPKDQLKEGKAKGHWKSIKGCSTNESLWRSDLWEEMPDRDSTFGRMILEMSIMLPGSHRRQVVACHKTRQSTSSHRDGVYRLPWYRGVFHKVRPVLNRAVCRGCKVFIRWTRVTPRYQNKVSHVVLGREFDYAWSPHSQRGHNTRLMFES